MSQREEFRKLIRTYVARGWEVTRRKCGHLCLCSPIRKTKVFMPSTPSDHRSLKNVKAKLKRVEKEEAGEDV